MFGEKLQPFYAIYIMKWKSNEFFIWFWIIAVLFYILRIIILHYNKKLKGLIFDHNIYKIYLYIVFFLQTVGGVCNQLEVILFTCQSSQKVQKQIDEAVMLMNLENIKVQWFIIAFFCVSELKFWSIFKNSNFSANHLAVS